MLKRLDRWLSEDAPVFWVVGISLLFLGAALRLLSGLFEMLDWPLAAQVSLWLLGALVACFVAAVLWFVAEALSGRPTPWRRSARR